MKPLVEFIRSTIIAGLLVILPIGLMAVVIIKIVDLLKQVLTPGV